MAQPDGGIGNVTTNTGLVEMAMAYSRSRVLCAAARLGVADALGDEVRSVGFLAEHCQADADALYRLLRALASIGVTEETTPEHFRLTPFGKPLRGDVPQSVWAAVIFWADLLADDWSLLTDCVRTGKPASQVRDPKIPSRWDAEANSIFRCARSGATPLWFGTSGFLKQSLLRDEPRLLRTLDSFVWDDIHSVVFDDYGPRDVARLSEAAEKVTLQSKRVPQRLKP